MRNTLILLLCITTLGVSAQQLTSDEVQQRMTWLQQEWKQQARAKYSYVMEQNAVMADTLKMNIFGRVYGPREAPEGGRSLWISLHGGGNAPKELNDGQWRNQTMLYTPAEGVYVAPRAPYNDWDMWFKPGLDSLYEHLIEFCVACHDVNPDKVYLLGYSAGGDGVWRMGPRMADRWAAASMMAGHPGDVSLLSLRNTPFMIWCGALDAAYNRNEECTQRGIQMDSLYHADPEGYIHETHIVEGKPHWMDRVDTAAISWMYRYTRNPYPRRIVWQQGDRMHRNFYWLTLPDEVEPKKGDLVRVDIQGQTITISDNSYPSLTLWLNDELVNLDKKVTIKQGKKTLFKGKLPRTEENLRESLFKRNDLRYCFPSRVTVKCTE